jgi:hypothetical protein
VRSLPLLAVAFALAVPFSDVRAQTAGNSPAPGGAALSSRNTGGFHFAGIPWGSDSATVKAALAREGLRYVAADSVGDLSFVGRVIDREATAIAWMADGHLVRLDVRFASAPQLAVPLYREVWRALVAKYGIPSRSAETFDAPYSAGDGREDEAFKADKGHFIARWATPTTSESLLLYIDSRPGVTLLYASPEWTAAEQRRK